MLSVLLTSGALSDPVLIYSVERNILHVHAHKHTYTSTYIHTYIHTYTHAYTHIHTYIPTYIHIYTYIHTYMRTILPRINASLKKNVGLVWTLGGDLVYKTNKRWASNRHQGEAWQFVHVCACFLQRSDDRGKEDKKVKRRQDKKSYNISFKLIVVESAEKLKEAAVHELGADTCSKVWH